MGDIQSNEVQLWLVEDQQITEQSLLDEYKALLNAEEQTRYERLNFPKHQRQFLVSRALLRTVLGKYLQRPPESLVFARNAYGKPRIASFEKPLPISFNLSHTNGLSVLAVTPGDDLGVDVEYLTRKVDILKLAQRFFSKQEYDKLAALHVKDFDERFFRLWTLKEAYIKACGMGLAIPLKDFSFSFKQDEIAVSFAEQRNDEPAAWHFWQFVYQSRFQLALAQKLSRKAARKKLVARQGKPLEDFSTFEIVGLKHSF